MRNENQVTCCTEFFAFVCIFRFANTFILQDYGVAAHMAFLETRKIRGVVGCFTLEPNQPEDPEYILRCTKSDQHGGERMGVFTITISGKPLVMVVCREPQGVDLIQGVELDEQEMVAAVHEYHNDFKVLGDELSADERDQKRALLFDAKIRDMLHPFNERATETKLLALVLVVALDVVAQGNK